MLSNRKVFNLFLSLSFVFMLAGSSFCAPAHESSENQQLSADVMSQEATIKTDSLLPSYMERKRNEALQEAQVWASTTPLVQKQQEIDDLIAQSNYLKAFARIEACLDFAKTESFHYIKQKLYDLVKLSFTLTPEEELWFPADFGIACLTNKVIFHLLETSLQEAHNYAQEMLTLIHDKHFPATTSFSIAVLLYGTPATDMSENLDYLFQQFVPIDHTQSPMEFIERISLRLMIIHNLLTSTNFQKHEVNPYIAATSKNYVDRFFTTDDIIIKHFLMDNTEAIKEQLDKEDDEKLLAYDNAKFTQTIMSNFAGSIASLALSTALIMEQNEAVIYLKETYNRLKENGYSAIADSLQNYVTHPPKTYSEELALQNNFIRNPKHTDAFNFVIIPDWCKQAFENSENNLVTIDLLLQKQHAIENLMNQKKYGEACSKISDSLDPANKESLQYAQQKLRDLITICITQNPEDWISPDFGLSFLSYKVILHLIKTSPQEAHVVGQEILTLIHDKYLPSTTVEIIGLLLYGTAATNISEYLDYLFQQFLPIDPTLSPIKSLERTNLRLTIIHDKLSCTNWQEIAAVGKNYVDHFFDKEAQKKLIACDNAEFTEEMMSSVAYRIASIALSTALIMDQNDAVIYLKETYNRLKEHGYATVADSLQNYIANPPKTYSEELALKNNYNYIENPKHRNARNLVIIPDWCKQAFEGAAN